MMLPQATLIHLYQINLARARNQSFLLIAEIDC